MWLWPTHWVLARLGRGLHRSSIEQVACSVYNFFVSTVASQHQTGLYDMHRQPECTNRLYNIYPSYIHLPMKKGMLIMPVTGGVCRFASSAVAVLDLLLLIHFTLRPQLDFPMLFVMCALTSGMSNSRLKVHMTTWGFRSILMCRFHGAMFVFFQRMISRIIVAVIVGTLTLPAKKPIDIGAVHCRQLVNGWQPTF